MVAGAALAGWLVVWLASPAPEAPVAEVPPREERRAAIEPREAAPEPSQEPRAPRELAPNTEATPEDDPAEAIARDLDVLVRAVRKDKHVHNQTFPEDNTILDIPSLVPYIRTVDFWQPAFRDAKGDR